MKRKAIRILGVLTAVIFLAGCSGKTTSSEEAGSGESSGAVSSAAAGEVSFTTDTALKDIPVEEYVTLCDYKNLALPASAVSEEEVEENVRLVYLANYPEEKAIKDRAVQMKDTANIDFEGKKDGVAFQGGTSEGYNLTIGSGQFIDGFEDGLIGVQPGETVDLPLTFPEWYGNADLAGQEVVFTVKVNYIIPDGMDDEVIAQIGIPDVTDAAGLRKYMKEYLLSYHRDSMENQVIGTFVDSCTFEAIPDVLTEKFKANLKRNVGRSATAAGMELDAYMSSYYGMDIDAFLEQYTDYTLRMNVACQALANKENLNVSDEELEQMLQEYAGQAGFNTVDEFLGDTSREEFREYFMYQNAVDYLLNLSIGD